MNSDCLVTYVTFNSSYATAFSKVFTGEVTPQGRLERLKQTLKSKMKLMEDQDGTIQELESHLRRAKEDLARLKEKCDGKDKNQQSIELAKYEDKLRRFRDVLMGAISHLEKVLRNMGRCRDCSKCTCHRWAGEEGSIIHCIRKDLESIQIKRNLSDSRDTCDSGVQTADNIRSSSLKKSRSVNVRDIEKFRDKSLAGVNALEEMKEQVDVLYELVKSYFKQMPSDYEKCRIEECENKFEKLHEEFDGIMEALSGLLDSLNSTRSDGSDEANCNRKRLPCDSSALKSEHKQLQREICEQQTQLENIMKELKKAEMVLRERKCQAEEQEKDLRSREEEISQLRAGIKGFRERLRQMQIEMPDDVDDRRVVTSEGSYSSLSILSSELCELCELLTSMQSSFPGVVEKFKEENHQMKSTIGCLEKCLDNKEQTLGLLQKTLRLRDGQIEDLNCRIQSLEGHVEKLNQEICEKTRLIGNLQDSMRRAKEFEMKIKDECIAALQCEICELDSKLKVMVQEVAKKTKELDDLQDEILYVSSKNFFLNREIDLIEPKLGKMQKNLVLYETMLCELQKELNSRQCEIEELYEKVRVLEQELECETRKCEQQTLNDSEHINQLNETIRHLQNELQYVNSSSRRSSPVGSGRSPKRRSECSETEDPCKKPNPKEVICQLRAEIKALRQRIKQSEKKDEIKAKVAHLERIIRQGECRQQMYNDEINELRKIFEDTVATHQREKEKLMEKLRKEEMDNCKNKSILCKLNESIKHKMTVENALKETIENLSCDLESFKSENESLKSELENVKRVVKDNRDELDREDLDKLITELEAQKSDLKTRCCTLKCELEKEEKMKKCLENRINELNDMLSEKTLQFQQLSQNYKFTSAEAQEALAKLKDAEDRLKCMKMAMNKKDAECEEDGEDEIDDMQRKSLEDSLTAKTVECNNLMNEVECLQEKLKTVQNNYVAAQANKDFELERANGEIHRLENELDLVEKQNAKLRKEIKILQVEVKKLTKIEECYKEEIKKKNKEICDLVGEKKSSLESIDELQKRLEEICIDNTAKESENMKLREETINLRKEMSNMETEMCDTRQDFETLRQECSQTVEQLSCSERKICNLKKLYKKATEENASLEQTRCSMEKELYQLRNENTILKQRMQCARKHKEMEARKLMAENAAASEEKFRLSNMIKDLNSKVRTLEESVIPQLQEEIMRKNRCIETFKIELRDANSSGQRMRDESLRVIQSTKKYLATQKNGNEPFRAKSPCQKDNRYSDNRELEEQYKSDACMNAHYFEVREKNPFQDAEPRSFSPQPWGCSNVERDNSSPDYANESGFQSMQPSPTNMNYTDNGHDMKRTMSQWNNVVRQMENQYPCRSPSTR